jgi:demethylmenaquinone methyltransferase/2-methoxy-6-polyprenyl-1,4-benzoquinol methylase
MAANPWWAPWALSRIIEPLMPSLKIQTPSLVGMKAGDRALDICCGTGALVIHLAKMNLVACGIDMDQRVIQIAEKKKAKLGLGNASFQVANALNLPFKDNFFDYASISMTIHESPRAERDTIISEMRRVVKKKGKLVFIDYRVPMPKIPSSYTSKIVELIAGKEHNRCFKDYLQHGGLDALLEKHNLHVEKRGELGPLVITVTQNNS